ncbi:phosphatase PAP2 family protein [Dactylosporangium fulvum]|uniref:Phosphatase PAP2 family protein n=1 Tax=Dactylosporangium fulvum TaxID=53359 RepID=A0ABY5WA60_9ACTN|nr:phosphatase PAP2 family protein [Dactylosporangium fulvum]UWP86235.1 phosphatase PAP2 family protein [Dactylosporangium fulvum]
MRGWPVGLALWLLLLAVVETVGFVEVWRFFVQTEHGQLLDYVALTGNSIGRARVESVVHNTLNGISVLSLTVATIVIGFIALARRRVALAVGAVLLIGGANATTQLLKAVIYRPDLGVDVERAAVGNSLPSGHTTIAASVAVAFVLVLPAKARGPGALVAALFAALAGVATLSAGWHRPSDAVAALLIVGAWAAVTGLFIVLAQRRHGGVEYGPPSTYMTLFLALLSLGLLAGAGLALYVTDDALATAVEDLSRRRLFAAYAGGALGIAGTAGLMVASVLATVHRVVPQVVPPDPEETDAAEPPTVRLHVAEGPPPDDPSERTVKL